MVSVVLAKPVVALVAVSILASSLLALPISAQDMGAPEYANRIIEKASGPVLEPGDDGPLLLTIRNPSQSGGMGNITLKMSIYLYRSLEDQQNVSGMERPPTIANSGLSGSQGSTEYIVPMFDLRPNETRELTITINTWGSTPHPGYFDQGAYFVRLWMHFDHGGVNYTLFSRGYFSQSQWDGYRQQSNVSQAAARQYLRNISCDGIILDTSFTVRLKIPLWPLALLVLATCGTGMLALMYYLEENPGKAPKLEKAFQGARGKAKQAWALCKQAFRKP